jgi:hypothetical protein
MKHLLLVYHDPTDWERLSAEQKRALHRDSQWLAEAPGIVAHYRLRRSNAVTTVRSENGCTAITEGRSSEQKPPLRAVLVCESESPDAAVELALQLPVVRLGATVEIRPLTG